MGNYTIYHLHSDQSNGTTNIDSVTKYGDYIKAAQKCGMKSLAFSEHGNIFEWVHKKEAIEAAGMKYIHAIEAYLTEGFCGENGAPIADNYHCVLIAKNYDGVKELNRLSSASYNRNDGHFYYKPRILFEELFATSDNIIITSACLGGCFHNGTPSAKERMLNFFRRNAHRCYFEIQHHNCKEQIDYNQLLYKLSVELSIPLIAGTDTHALNDWHMKGRALLQKSKGVSFDDESEWDLTFKSYEELIEAYRTQNSLPMEVVQEAIENTNRMADKVEPFKLDYSPKYPKLYSNSKEVFREKIRKGIKWRGIDKLPNYQEYLDRIEYEIGVYEHNDAVDFMLLEEDYKSEMRRRNIRFGYSRGSVSGSIVAYVLGITEMDSVKYNLNFERFMNVERVSLADIDTDWYSEDRDEVKKYLHQKEGLYCCDIVTFNTIALRGAIKAICKGMHIANMEMLPDSLKGEINKSKAKNKGEESYSLELTKKIEQEYKKRAQFKEVSLEYLKVADTVIELAEQDEEKARAKYQTIFEYVDLVSGVIVSVGNHPAGCVVSPFPVDEWFGTFTTKDNEYPISVLNMKEIDSLNFVKLDLLCIDNLGLIYKTCDAVGLPYLTPDNTPPDDEAVWKSIRDDTTMIFQWESQSASAYLKQLLSDTTIKKIRQKNPDASYMDLLSIGNGAIRPAGESYRNQLAAGEYKSYGNKELDEFMKPTLGYMTYQEEIIEFLYKFCGFTMGEADVVRRCVDENTLITMDNGEQKRICDVKVGDVVQTFDDTRITHNSVTNVFDNGYSEVYDVVCENQYTIRATKSHKVLTQRGYVTVGELTDGDYLFTPTKLKPFCDDKRPNQRLSQSDMFLIGMLLGDGAIGGPDYQLHFTNSDLDLINAFEECVNNRLRKKHSCQFRITTQAGVTVEKVYSIYIKSKEYQSSVYNLLNNFGLLTKSRGKHIPTEFMNYPVGDKLTSLIAGLFSTDGGYIASAMCIEYYSISKMLADNIKNILLRYGIYSYVYARTSKKYGYDYYTVRINQRKSLEKFLKNIVPFVRGIKKKQFVDIISNSLQKEQSYNYVLPKVCIEEMREALELSDISMRSVNVDHLSTYGAITDIKALKIVQNAYCPETYKLLTSDYEPIKLKKVESVGMAHVYDIEVANTHNYIANGVIVHNCFAKKTGTQDIIPTIKDGGYLTNSKDHYIKGFIQTMQDDYGVPREEAENLIGDFLQVIIDASDYLFSKNHADPYSWIGYICGYLRYYYPVEFITTALNIFETDNKKSATIIEYAKKQGVQIFPIKFRHSGAKYTSDTENFAIYKGISSIKYMNNEIADRLLELKDTQIDTFIDLLFLMKQNSIPVDARQLKGLVFLNFFSEFGEPNKLWKLYQLFDKFYGKKQVKKDTLSGLGLPLDICEGIAEKETPKMFSGVNMNEMLNRAIPYAQYDKYTLKQRLEAESEYLGYIDVHDSKYNGYAVVLEVNTKYTPRVKMHALKSGGIYDCKINKKLFNKLKLNKGDLIRVRKQLKKPKYRMDEHQKFVPIAGEVEIWIEEYEIIKDILA